MLALGAGAQTSPPTAPPAPATVQVWEKPVAPGITYRQEVDLAVPRITHILRFRPGSGMTRAAVELGSGLVYKADRARGRGTVSEMVERTGAIAAINGDYFPFTGDPLGLMIHEGQLMSLPFIVRPNPYTSRAVFGWSDTGATIADRVRFSGTVKIGDLPEMTLDGLNQEAPANSLVLNQPVAGLAQAKVPNVHVRVQITRADWSPNGETTGVVELLTADTPALPVERGTILLTASDAKAATLAQARPGQPVRIRFNTQGIDLKRATEAIGGGPVLVRNGRIDVTAAQEGFGTSHTDRRHPRTAIGRASDGEIWLIVVDGRQKMSAGSTLPELAQQMLGYGLVDAINLDGGGSSAMNLFGGLINRPSDPNERPVANGIVLFGPRPAVAEEVTLTLPTTLKVGDAVDLVVRDAKGEVVPNAEVFWNCTGPAAWIDQGGRLRVIDPGAFTVTAFARGKRISVSGTIAGATPAAPPATPPKAA